MQNVLRLLCPAEPASTQEIALGAGWLTRAPGGLTWLSWHCPCGQTHDLAIQPARHLIAVMRDGDVRVANVAGAQELMDPKRSHGERLGEDDVQQVIDELYLDGEDHHLVTRFSEGFVESVQDEFLHRRAAAGALQRASAVLHRMRRPRA